MARRANSMIPRKRLLRSRACTMSSSAFSSERSGHPVSTPGYHTVDVLLAEGDMVAGKVTGYGTHEGELLGIPRTGKKIQMSGIVIWRIRNGKIIEHWGQNDTLGLLQQLGALPPPGKPQRRT